MACESSEGSGEGERGGGGLWPAQHGEERERHARGEQAVGERQRQVGQRRGQQLGGEMDGGRRRGARGEPLLPRACRLVGQEPSLSSRKANSSLLAVRPVLTQPPTRSVEPTRDSPLPGEARMEEMEARPKLRL